MKTNHKQLESVLIKPSGPDCNMECGYCFYLEKADLFQETTIHRMSDRVLEETIKQVMGQSGKHVSFAWQGGEPTLMGLDFYKKAVDIQKRYGRGKSVTNTLQTNGLLINEEWADFFNEYQFLIGLSIDGPQAIHDRFRKTQNGKPTWEHVMKTAQLLHNKGVSVNAMTCITNDSAPHASEIYLFLKEAGFNWMQFIPVVETDKNNPAVAADFSLTDESYGIFMIEIFDLWLADFKDDQPTTSVRYIDSIFHTYVGLPAPECTLRKECGLYLTIEHNGNVYSCDFFVEPEWKLGNIETNQAIEMLNSKKQTQFGKIKSDTPQKCKTCVWYKHCFAGCPKDNIKDPRDGGMPRFCKSQTMFLEYADPIYRKMADSWKKQQKTAWENSNLK